jgi:hypothetical protein
VVPVAVAWRATHVVLLLLLGAGCQSAAQLTTRTGLDLEGVGRAFVEVAGLWDEMLDAGAVTAADYRAWAAFGRKFQQSYSPAVAVWRQGLATQDLRQVRQAAIIIEALDDGLRPYAARAYRWLYQLPGGS